MGFWSKNNTRRGSWAAVMLLWLFISYVGGITLFMHRHTIEGQTIYHSHFYSGSADSPNHSHTSQQCKVITALSLYIALAATMAAMVVAPLFKVAAVINDIARNTIQQSLQLQLLRAPPVFI